MGSPTATNVELHSYPQAEDATLFRVLTAISVCHLVNDMVQSLLPSIYPILKTSFQLNFSQIGLIALTYQVTASLLQPVVGFWTDKTPKPFILPFGMIVTLIGLLLLSIAPTFPALLFAASCIGIGSAVFHPESSRVARLASGGRHGLAQSFFQVGGNAGSAIGPLLAAFIVLPHGQKGTAWFVVPVIPVLIVLYWVSGWYKTQIARHHHAASRRIPPPMLFSKSRVIAAMTVLVALIFSKYFYLASLSNYFTFYLIQRFGVSVHSAQLHLFVFLGAVAAGTLMGGPIGDRFGRKLVIWFSILGVLPFSLILPHADLFWTGILSAIIGFILASAFSAILVYAQELVPGRIGMISGLFFGFAFGMGGIGAAILGKLADVTSIFFVYKICAYLPAIGLLTILLPDLKPRTATQ